MGQTTFIVQVSFNSPLEYVMLFYTGGTALILLAAQYAKLRANMARSKTVVHKEHVKQAAYSVLLAHIKETGQNSLFDLIQSKDETSGRAAREALDEAALSLTEIETIEELD